MGADVMRWQYCAQPPDRNLLFGFGPAHEIKRKLLTLWNSARFLVDYATIEGFRPEWGARGAESSAPLDRWLVARTAKLVAEATDGLRGVPDGGRDPRLRRVRRRPLELVHPPLAAPLLGRRRGRAAGALDARSSRAARDRAGDAVPRRAPLAEPRARRGRGSARVGLPRRLARSRGARTTRCSPRSPRCAGSSRSAIRRARRRG